VTTHACPAQGNSQLQSGESSLLDALRAGQQAGYERLVREHGGRMLSTALRIMGREEDARDAVQDALLSVFKSIGGFDGNSKLSTWLHRIVVNACLMRLRARGRRPEVSIENLLPRFDRWGHRDNPGPAWNPSPEAGIECDRLRLAVREAIDLLPDGYREVLVLRDLEEVDTEATAQALGLTPGAVKTRLHRARQALRALLVNHVGRQGRAGDTADGTRGNGGAR